MRTLIIPLKFLVLISFLAFSACNSGSTDGGGSSGADDQFVSTDNSVGRVELDVNEDRLSIGDTSGFFVRVVDAKGAPVSATRISCDTEQGLALIEPTTGSEITDSNGSMSGRVGCELPGSFQIACRLPIGANKRKFATVVCSGDIPAGFTGWPDAGGGGLGGGVDTSGNDGPLDIRVSAVEFYDTGDFENSTTSIDIAQGTCGTAPDLTAEPFFDSHIRFTITNNTNEAIRLTKYRYTVNNFNGTGGSHTSPFINFLGEVKTVDANGGAGSVFGLFLDANSGGKSLFGRNDLLTADGFKNMTFTIVGIKGSGEEISITVRGSASFDNFNNCTAS